MSRTSAARRLLLPLTPLYRLALALRERRLASGKEVVHRSRFPVISIGNLSTGGAGKTPLTIALAQALTRRGFAIDVLSRGYGRTSTVPARVNPQGSAQQYGDEPLLIARQAAVPVYVAPQRYDAALLAESEIAAPLAQLRANPIVIPTPPRQAELAPPQVEFAAPQVLESHERCLSSQSLRASSVSGHDFSRAITPPTKTGALAPEGCSSKPQIHLLDDGFQHRQLHRDIDILLLNRADWHGRLLPAGNLREPLRALHRAHVIAIPATEPELEPSLRAAGWQGPVWRLHRRMQIPVIHAPVLAFCGIARPHQFFAGLRESGIDVASTRIFPDHRRYTQRDLDRLAAQAGKAGATTLLTNEKDAIRLAGLASSLPIATVALRTEIEDEQSTLTWLLNALTP